MTAERRIRGLEEGEAALCEAILRDLPEWFGIEEAIVSYSRDIVEMETLVVSVGSSLTGFLTIRRHNPRSAEIQVMAVHRDHHREGHGRALVEAAEAQLKGEGTEWFQVKTLGPSRASEEYAQTRRFYERCGFAPLEENTLWGEVNPCLMLVKHLGCA